VPPSCTTVTASPAGAARTRPSANEPHRYFFRLYALDTHLGLDTTAGVDEVRAALDGHVLSTGTLVGLFVR
jgi:phosphatidylethanolamine-binding protein (PEBP) family uncharacterized protein